MKRDIIEKHVLQLNLVDISSLIFKKICNVCYLYVFYIFIYILSAFVWCCQCGVRAGVGDLLLLFASCWLGPQQVGGQMMD